MHEPIPLIHVWIPNPYKFLNEYMLRVIATFEEITTLSDRKRVPTWIMRHFWFSLSYVAPQPKYLCAYFLHKTISSQITNNSS